MDVIRVDTSSVRAMLKRFPDSVAIPAAVRGINKALANTRTAASSGIRKRRALSASVVRDALRIKKATKAKLSAALVVSGRPIPLRDYKARQTRKGVTAMVSTGARKLVTHHGNASFLVSKLGGHVFAREGTDRLPLKKLYGPSIPSTFLTEEVRTAWETTARTAIVKRTNEELHFELQKKRLRRGRS